MRLFEKKFLIEKKKEKQKKDDFYMSNSMFE